MLFLLLSSCAMTKKAEVNLDRDFPHHEIQKIAVLMFETTWQNKSKTKLAFSKSIVNPNAGIVLTKIISKELAKWGRYVVLDRRALEEGLKLMNLNNKDFLQKGDYLNLGKSLGIDAIVICRIERFGISYRSLLSGSFVSLTAKVSFHVNCIDIITNKTIWSIRIDGSSKKDDEKILASKLVAKAFATLNAQIK